MIAGAAPKPRWNVPETPDVATSERSKWTQMLQRAEDWLADHPVICISGAVIMGVTVGWLVKRR